MTSHTSTGGCSPKISKMKIAVIDIGSNSVRLMMWADGKTLYKRLFTTRLGDGLAQTGLLKKEAIERSAQAVAEGVLQATEEGAERIALFATAAVRSASNGADFCARVKALCGRDVDVVSGEEEALLGLSGALGVEDGAIIDVGGASTEVCIREKGSITFAVSIPLGAVRLLDTCGQDKEKLNAVIEGYLPLLDGACPCGRTYAIGGTATTVAAVVLGLEEYDAAKVQGLCIPQSQLFSWADKLLSMTVEERKKLPGMEERRAEIIGGGALLLAKIVEKLSLCKLYVSDSDNQEGYLYQRRLYERTE